MMIPELAFTVTKWWQVGGSDGGVHCIPVGEEHEPHYICVCNPVQIDLHAGYKTFVHRILSC